jgi:hypothetical protein
MASPVVTAFHTSIAVAVGDDMAELLRRPAGGAMEAREMARALLLAHRASTEWAGGAIAAVRPTAQNRLEELGPFLRPEAGYFDLEPAAQAAQRIALNVADMPIIELTGLALKLGQALAGTYEDAPVSTNTPEFEDVGRVSAEILSAAGALRENPDWVLEEANRTLLDLIAP